MNFSPLRTWMDCLAVLAGFTLAGSVAMAQEPGGATPNTKNLLVNGSFEKGTEGWTFEPHEKRGIMTLDENEKHGGKPSVRIENPADEDSHFKQKVTVEPETRYRLEGYIKTKDVKAVKRDSKGGATLDLEGTWQHTVAVNKTKSWTKVSIDIVTGAQTEVEVGARLGYWSDGVIGTAWFADLSLVKIGKAPPRR
ncbi:MAG: carbohydrate binding domain-containing protein [Chthoniobacter sp.]|uniref:carbohydrate binding domain-containing protein n=1 Tax=Chthoniobacter sp. TaxID=2510640 RepID=UPI0032A538B6